jgi:small-conductance mechanosensitive channel
VTINETIAGFVEEPGLRVLKLRLIDGTLFTISNGEIRNVSNGNEAKRRIDIQFVISYRENPIRIRGILEKACVDLNDQIDSILFRKEDGKQEEDFVPLAYNEWARIGLPCGSHHCGYGVF